jgi:DNA-binding transcriptional LysR family regulator
MHVRQIEERYGVTLFERSSTGVKPTEAGRRFYEAAIRVLDEASKAESVLRDLSGSTSGHVKIGLMPTFTRSVLGPVLIRAAKEAPNIRVSVHEAYSAILSQEVVEGRLDFAVVPAVDSALGLNAITMGQDRECLVCSANNTLNLGSSVKLSDLPPQSFVLPRSINARRPRIDHYFAVQNVTVKEVIELDSMLGTIDLVTQSDRVSILPGILCLPDLDGKRRQITPLNDPPLHTDYIRVTPKARDLSDAAQTIANILQEELNNALEIDPVSGR